MIHVHSLSSPPPPPNAESRVCGRADVPVELLGDLGDEQIGLAVVLSVLLASRARLMLLKTPQEEEQLQPAKHKQPGAQHHTDKREANDQQVGSPVFFCAFGDSELYSCDYRLIFFNFLEDRASSDGYICSFYNPQDEGML